MAKMTKKGQNFVSGEISHLMKHGPRKGPQKGKTMPQKQAIAVALSVARRKGFKSAPNPKEETAMSASIFDKLLSERELSTADRKHIKRSNFAIPEKAPGSGSYPIHDLAHARNALARVSANGSPAEKTRVDAAVYKKYPGLKDRAEESTSVFDALVERELPEAFKKNIAKFSAKTPDEKGEEKGEEVEEKGESASLFDPIIQESRGSLFDEIVDKGVEEDKDGWDDRLARTLTLAESLVEIRNTIKSKAK